MSMLADLESVCTDQPMTKDQCAALFFDILERFNCDIDGITTQNDAYQYLYNRDQWDRKNLK